ncbi:MAG: VWA domain-containing protein [Blastocatellia bacterium]|nr:VWA domain-containing protein [Blastocatellia bacterium]
MSVRLLIFFLLGAFFLGAGNWTAAAQTPAQSAPPAKAEEDAFSIEATLVTVPVIVTDAKGHCVTGLKQADFTLLDENTKQEITFFDAADAPLTVAILLDTSFSTSSVLPQIKEAATAFLQELRPRDQALVLSFDSEIKLLMGQTGDKNLMARGVALAEIGKIYGTRLNDAISQTVKQHLRAVTGRKAIVLLTDGKDLKSRITAEQLLSLTAETNTVIYTIFFRTESEVVPPKDAASQSSDSEKGRPRRVVTDSMTQKERVELLLTDANARREWMERRNRSAQAFMHELAYVTAGRDFISDVGDLKLAFRTISDELRAQYTLGFYPESTTAAGRHGLKVEVSRQGLTIRARQNYRSEEKGAD